MFRTRAEVRQSMLESFQTASLFLGFGLMLTGVLIGAAYLACLLH